MDNGYALSKTSGMGITHKNSLLSLHENRTKHNRYQQRSQVFILFLNMRTRDKKVIFMFLMNQCL